MGGGGGGVLLRDLNFDVSLIIFKIPLSYEVLSKTTMPFSLSGCKIAMSLFFRKVLRIPCFLRSAVCYDTRRRKCEQGETVP